MDAKEQFEIRVNNQLSQFLTQLHQEPEMFTTLRKDIVKIITDLKKEFPNKKELYHKSAIVLVDIMSRGIYLYRFLNEAITKGDATSFKPGVLLEKIDNLPGVDEDASVEMISLVAESIKGALNENPTLTFEDLFYDNYLGEYISNIFFVSALESLGSDPLFEALHQQAKKNPQEDLFLELFNDGSSRLKEDLEVNFPDYQTTLEENTK